MNEQQIETLNQMLIEHESIVRYYMVNDDIPLSDIANSRSRFLQYIANILDSKVTSEKEEI